MNIGRYIGAGLFKGTAFVGAIVVIMALWVFDSDLLVSGEDLNLHGIKLAASFMPAGYGSKFEAALRVFGADRAFLFAEIIAGVKLCMITANNISLFLLSSWIK